MNRRWTRVDRGHRGAGHAVADRATLVDAVIHALDRSGSEAVRARLLDALGAVGVRAVGEAGERFDTALHEAVGSEPATEPGLVGTIATVDQPGFVDGESLLRPARVVVFGESP